MFFEGGRRGYALISSAADPEESCLELGDSKEMEEEEPDFGESGSLERAAKARSEGNLRRWSDLLEFLLFFFVEDDDDEIFRFSELFLECNAIKSLTDVLRGLVKSDILREGKEFSSNISYFSFFGVCGGESSPILTCGNSEGFICISISKLKEGVVSAGKGVGLNLLLASATCGSGARRGEGEGFVVRAPTGIAKGGGVTPELTQKRTLKVDYY